MSEKLYIVKSSIFVHILSVMSFCFLVVGFKSYPVAGVLILLCLAISFVINLLYRFIGGIRSGRITNIFTYFFVSVGISCTVVAPLVELVLFRSLVFFVVPVIFLGLLGVVDILDDHIKIYEKEPFKLYTVVLGIFITYLAVSFSEGVLVNYDSRNSMSEKAYHSLLCPKCVFESLDDGQFIK